MYIFNLSLLSKILDNFYDGKIIGLIWMLEKTNLVSTYLGQRQSIICMRACIDSYDLDY